MNVIYKVARLITEDPDVFNNTVILEADNPFAAPGFNDPKARPSSSEKRPNYADKAPKPGVLDRIEDFIDNPLAVGHRAPTEQERIKHPSRQGITTLRQRLMERIPFSKAKAQRKAEDELHRNNPQWTWSGNNVSPFPDASGKIPRPAVQALILSPRLLEKNRPGLLKNMAGQRWPVAEPAISRDPILASQYATRVLRNRWPEAEATIATDPLASTLYIYYILKTRWPDVERSIAADKSYSPSLQHGGLARVYRAILASNFQSRRDVEIILQDLIDQRSQT